MLFLFTGGILVPIKALVLNLLSLTASFGAACSSSSRGICAGWSVISRPLDTWLETTIPVLAFCVALVPAFMKITGRANWWAPRVLVRVHQRWGLRESAESESAPLPKLVHRA